MAAAKKTEPKKKVQTDVVISPVVIHEFDLTLVGTSILVVNSMVGKLAEDLRRARYGTAKPKKHADEESYNKECRERFEAARYRLPNGQDGFPAVTIKYALVDECTFIDGVEKTKMRAALTVNHGEFLCPIYHDAEEPTMREDVVRVGGRAGRGSGTASLAYRPEYRSWRIPIRITYDPTLVTAQQIVALASRAGFHQGIGEWRKPKGGEWGRFAVEEGVSIPNNLFPKRPKGKWSKAA